MGDTVRSIALPLEGAYSADVASGVRAVNPDEAALIQELQAGSEDAFAYLLAVYRTPIYNMVYHITGDEADAGDVLQNAFVKIVRGIKQFHGSSSLKTWIYRIAVHEALNCRRGWFRRRRREVFSLDDLHGQREAERRAPAESETPYEWLEQNERREAVTRALGSLCEPYRTVVILREMENFSYEEITEVLGVAEGTVKSRLKRGRELLRRKLASCAALRS
ncbi:MAG TPA: sigma-70 family RNA polymerase sigma factor [Terriglobia bacterium]|nr:sigma-70 family RNA polymerase sigma factor [Terriglobia bacterium]